MTFVSQRHRLAKLRGAGPALLLATALSLWSAPAHAQGELPWDVGASVPGVGTLERVQRHPEYVRTQWRDGEQTHRIEIVPRSDQTDPWAAGPYRVQPAPGARANNAALSAMRAHLEALSAAPGHAPFVGRARAPTSPEDALEVPTSRGDKPYPPPGAPWLLLALFMGVILALIALVRSRPPGSAERTIAARGVAAATLIGLGSLIFLDPRALNPALITVLHEGNTEHVIRALWGSGHHGPLWDAMRWALSTLGGYEEVLPIRVLVTLNLTLAAINLTGLAVAARLVVGSWRVAALVVVTLSISPLFLNAALSELTAQPLLTVCLAMAGAIAAGPRQRALSVVALLLLTCSLGLLRAEWFMAGGLIAAASIATPYLEARGSSAPRLSAALVLLLAAGAYWGAPMLLEGERATYLTQGLTPTDWGPLAMPLVYAMGLGVGLVLLGILGAGRLLTMAPWVGVPLALVLLTRMYTEASHRGQAPYETLRYGQLMLPLLLGCSLIGWRALLQQTRWTGSSKRTLVIVVAALHLAPVGEVIASRVFSHHHLASSPLYGAPLDRDQQREARALIALIEEPSTCVAVAVSARDPKPTDPIEGWDYVFFGGSLGGPLTAERAPARLQDHLKNLGSPDCARFFSGLDCHVEGYEGCEPERAMGAPGEALGVEQRPYYDHLTRDDSARLQVVRWDTRETRPTSPK